jgi:hypothetical protein
MVHSHLYDTPEARQAIKQWTLEIYMEEYERLEAGCRQLLATLAAVEWIDVESWDMCPSCHATKSEGHAPDCQLAAALRAAKGEGQ